MNSTVTKAVAFGLVACLLLAVTGCVLLPALHAAIPAILENVATTALGAVAALLVRIDSSEPAPMSEPSPAPVPAAEPVEVAAPVEPAPATPVVDPETKGL